MNKCSEPETIFTITLKALICFVKQRAFYSHDIEISLVYKKVEQINPPENR